MLKSGWSVRTAIARSPTNSKTNGITDSEKKHITAVLARAEERRVREQQRIGFVSPLYLELRVIIMNIHLRNYQTSYSWIISCKLNFYSRMIGRLEKLKARATGNGITQCYLCSTDFGLLAPRSYAAMCLQCRRVI